MSSLCSLFLSSNLAHSLGNPRLLLVDPGVGSSVLPITSPTVVVLPTGLAESLITILPIGKIEPRREVELGGVGGYDESVEDARRRDLSFKLKERVEVCFVARILKGD